MNIIFCILATIILLCLIYYDDNFYTHVGWLTYVLLVVLAISGCASFPTSNFEEEPFVYMDYP